MSRYIATTSNSYPGMDRGFNQRWTLDENVAKVPQGGVYLVQDAQDIVETLNSIAAAQGELLPGDIKAVSGGHCYENFTFQKGSESTVEGRFTKYVVDLSDMRGIYEETVAGQDYVVVEPGASNWLIGDALQTRYGASIPGGSCYSVCAGGHIAGGGYGLLSRLHGLTVDYLAGVQMVIPGKVGKSSFRVREFTGSDDDQLDWASKGGGSGHFGLITKYYFPKNRLPKSPERALFITLPVPWSNFSGINGAAQFHEFLVAYHKACAALPAQAFALGKLTTKTSDSDHMTIALQVVYGSSSGHDADVLGGYSVPAISQAEAMTAIENFAGDLGRWMEKPTRSAFAGAPHVLRGHPVVGVFQLDTVYDLPWIDMTQLLNGSGENQKGK